MMDMEDGEAPAEDKEEEKGEAQDPRGEGTEVIRSQSQDGLSLLQVPSSPPRHSMEEGHEPGSPQPGIMSPMGRGQAGEGEEKGPAGGRGQSVHSATMHMLQEDM
jgi:hypothetical protein